MTHHRNEMFRHPREAQVSSFWEDLLFLYDLLFSLQIAVFNALTYKYFQSGFKMAIKGFLLSSIYALSSRTIDVAT
jgi:hypothetical protein